MEDIKNAIENLKEMYPKKCQMVDGRLTGGFDDYESEKGKAITLAINSLEAWEYVIDWLEDEKQYPHYRHNFYEGLDFAIDIINQKLAEIK